jgi:hypothetical protein
MIYIYVCKDIDIISETLFISLFLNGFAVALDPAIPLTLADPIGA